MFKKIKTNNFYLYSTEVENFFISDFLPGAKGEYVKAYLLALMYAQLGSGLDNASLKSQLKMSDDEIEDCWEYWESQGVIKRISEKDSSGYEVEFVNLRELIGSAPCEQRVESSVDDKELAKLYKDVQRATGRMIDLREMQEIVSWINDLNINPDLILACYTYCAAKRKSSAYRYVGCVLRDWNDKGLKTPEDLEAYLNENDSRFGIYKSVFSELGFSRNPTAEEKRLMNDWIDKYHFTQNDILYACKQTIAISNPNLKYVDSVLKNTKGNANAQNKESVAVRINKMYEEIRKENEKKTEALHAAVFSKLPGLKTMIKEQGELSIKQSRAMLRRDKAAFDEAKRLNEEIENKKISLLLAAGFDKNVLDNIYSCSKCKDTGVSEDGSPCSCYAEKLEILNGEI